VVPVLLGPGIPRSDGSEEDYECYCCSILLLFKSWRDLGDLRAECTTWSAAFDACDFSPSLKAIIRNMNVENECKEACDAHAANVREKRVRPHLYGIDANGVDVAEDLE
ncbi:hypothetical protein C8R48DRAFT_554801, partial [Suillus tomentosus]